MVPYDEAESISVALPLTPPGTPPARRYGVDLRITIYNLQGKKLNTLLLPDGRLDERNSRDAFRPVAPLSANGSP